MRDSVLLISLLLLASLLVDAVALVNVGPWGRDDDLAWTLVLALVFGQTNLAAIWFALGSSPVSLRFVSVFAVPVAWGCALFLLLDRRSPGIGEAVVDLLVQASLVAVPLLVIRLLGCEVLHIDAAGDADRRPDDLRKFQFSIRQILGWTTAIAIVLGVMKYVDSIEPLEFKEVSDSNFVAFIIVRAGIALTALWVALGTRWPVLRFAALGVLEVTAIMTGQGRGIFRQDLAMHLKFHVAEAIVLLGSLWVVRVAGYRLRWRRSRDGEGSALEPLSEGNGKMQIEK